VIGKILSSGLISFFAVGFLILEEAFYGRGYIHGETSLRRAEGGHG
jgi:hypothetical protein